MSVTREEAPKRRLLAHQVNLLRHLTDPRAFEGSPDDPGLAAMDAERLRLVGMMSLAKRMSKIQTALPRTFTYVPHVEALSDAEFAVRFPPYTLNRYENAKQFVDYMRQRWEEQPTEPPFLPDLAAVEAAIVKVNSVIADSEGPKSDSDGIRVFRRARDVELVCCTYDVRTFFEDNPRRAPPVERDIRLIVASSRNQRPRICEISAKVYDLLRNSTGWRRLDLPEIRGDRELPGLIGTLTRMQIIEMAQ